MSLEDPRGGHAQLTACSALRRYTQSAHIAGNGNDKLDALNLKNEWETLLGLPSSGPEEKLYDAGSTESQESIRGKTKLDVWVDTVSHPSRPIRSC